MVESIEAVFGVEVTLSCTSVMLMNMFIRRKDKQTVRKTRQIYTDKNSADYLSMCYFWYITNEGVFLCSLASTQHLDARPNIWIGVEFDWQHSMAQPFGFLSHLVFSSQSVYVRRDADDTEYFLLLTAI